MERKKIVAGLLLGTLGLASLPELHETMLSSESDAVKLPDRITVRNIFVHHIEDEPREAPGVTNTVQRVVVVVSASSTEDDFIYKTSRRQINLRQASRCVQSIGR